VAHVSGLQDERTAAPARAEADSQSHGYYQAYDLRTVDGGAVCCCARDGAAAETERKPPERRPPEYCGHVSAIERVHEIEVGHAAPPPLAAQVGEDLPARAGKYCSHARQSTGIPLPGSNLLEGASDVLRQHPCTSSRSSWTS
jgi:hypothetical protein